MELNRTRFEEDGTSTEFTEHRYAGAHPFRAEIQFTTIDEIRDLHKLGLVIGVRMSPTPKADMEPQRNIVGVKHIVGL